MAVGAPKNDTPVPKLKKVKSRLSIGLLVYFLEQSKRYFQFLAFTTSLTTDETPQAQKRTSNFALSRFLSCACSVSL
jgi:hypothetical protein